MSRKSSRRDGGNGFLRKLAWTVLLALVFSAGLITGQRMIRSETRAPLVSVTSRSETPAADADSSGDEADDSNEKKELLFSFYDRLSEGGDSREPASDREQQPSGPGDEQTAEGSSDSNKRAADSPSDDSGGQPADESSEQTPDDSPSEAPDSEKSAAAKYTLQVSAYSSRDRARSRIRKLAGKGLDAHVVTAEVPEKGTYYRVRIGKFSTMEQAEKFQTELGRKRGVDTFVTPL